MSRQFNTDVDDHEYPRYFLKIDIAKCFYHVSRAKVLDMFRSITDDERFIKLVSTIINNMEFHTKTQMMKFDTEKAVKWND